MKLRLQKLTSGTLSWMDPLTKRNVLVGMCAAVMVGAVFSAYAEESERTYFLVGKDNRCGFISPSGVLLHRPEFEYIQLSGPGGAGWAWVEKSYSEPSYTGAFVAPDGKRILGGAYGRLFGYRNDFPVPYFENGVAIVALETKGACYIDGEGNFLGKAGHREHCNTGPQGWLAIELDGKIGYANSAGWWVIEPQFDRASLFRGDWAEVTLNGREIVINRSGQPVGPPGAESVWIADNSLGTFWVKLSGHIGLCSSSGEMLLAADYDEVRKFGRAPAAAFVRSGEKWGVVNGKGVICIRPVFTDVQPTEQQRFAKVYEESGVGLVDDSGRVLVPCKFDDVLPFSSRCAFVRVSEKWAVFDVRAQDLAPSRYEDVEVVGNDDFAVIKSAEGKGIIRSDGTCVVSPTYDDIILSRGSNPRAVVFVDGGAFGLLNIQDARLVLSNRFDRLSVWCDDLFEVRLGKSTGMVSSDGEWVAPIDLGIVDLPGPSFMSCRAGAFIGENGVGWMSESGEVVVPAMYDNVGTFGEGLLPVMRNGLWGYVDSESNLVIHFQFQDARTFCGGLAAVEERGLFGFIDTLGAWVIEPRYSNAGCCWNDLLPVAMESRAPGEESRELWGLVDRLGEVRLPVEYDSIEWGCGSAPPGLNPPCRRTYGRVGYRWL